MSVSFQNPGLIDLRAVTTFGISVKATTNPIGFFGTGLKYAIAIILRNGGKITIFRGTEPYVFTLLTETIRGEDFRTVLMNGERLGFTNQVGKTWEPWQAFRELESNCRDEMGETSYKLLEPSEDSTTIYVENFEGFDDAYRNIDHIFISGPPIVGNKYIEIHKIPGFFYYRGIRVAKSQDGVYSYNILTPLILTEDRTMKDKFLVEHTLRQFIINQCEDENFLTNFLTAPEGSYEFRLDLDFAWAPSETFKKVMGKLMASKKRTNHSARELMLKHKKTLSEFVEISMTEIQNMQLKKALDFLTMVFDFTPDRYPIRVVDSLNGEALGSAKDSTIYLSREAFNRGTKIVAGTVLEEYIHLDTGFTDCGRLLQDHLLNLAISLGEQLSGEPL